MAIQAEGVRRDPEGEEWLGDFFDRELRYSLASCAEFENGVRTIGLTLIHRLGGAVLDPGAAGLAGQISAIRSATTVIGVHGARLANLLFAGPDAQLFEIRTAANSNNSFRILYGVRGNSYIPLIATPHPDPEVHENEHDCSIDVDVVEQLLRARTHSR